MDATPNNASKQNLNEAFKVLRKMGYIARQAFSCCSSCAGYDICHSTGEAIKKDPRKKDKLRGCVFYTRQDYDSMLGTGEVYIAFGGMNITDIGRVGVSDVEVGNDVARVLREAGIEVTWNGSPDRRIIAHVPAEKVIRRRW